jgi:hypothetical protein
VPSCERPDTSGLEQAIWWCNDRINPFWHGIFLKIPATDFTVIGPQAPVIIRNDALSGWRNSRIILEVRSHHEVAARARFGAWLIAAGMSEGWTALAGSAPGQVPSCEEALLSEVENKWFQAGFAPGESGVMRVGNEWLARGCSR